ncbi:MAG: periplasmic heavy metal sensor [Thermodesulfobacteriota bacterium]|nr:periplasmic heavy metal sensor [Thermodesulfobacteriota bacterium]
MKKTVIMFSALLVVALMTSQAFSWGHGRGMGGYDRNCRGFIGSAWNDLSTAQKAELTELRQQFIDNTYELKVSMMQKHNEVRMLMRTSAPDRAKLSSMYDEIADLQKQIMEKRLDLQLAAKKVAPEMNFGSGAGCGFGFGAGQGFHKGHGKRSGGGQGQGFGYNQNQ